MELLKHLALHFHRKSLFTSFVQCAGAGMAWVSPDLWDVWADKFDPKNPLMTETQKKCSLSRANTRTWGLTLNSSQIPLCLVFVVFHLKSNYHCIVSTSDTNKMPSMSTNRPGYLNERLSPRRVERDSSAHCLGDSPQPWCGLREQIKSRQRDVCLLTSPQETHGLAELWWRLFISFGDAGEEGRYVL